MPESTNKASVITKVLIVLVLTVSVGAVLVVKQQKDIAESQSESTAALPVEASAAAEEPAAPLPKLIDLGASKCIPCKKMAPILDALKEEYKNKFDVVFIDVWKNTEEPKKYGIKLIPTQIFFDAEGKELFRHEGFFSREDILGKWADLGFSFDMPEQQVAESDEEGT